ncbi:hypothetical protein JTB14_033281 [Gonioctena quinquepunctata]|nr:hypothetical protein JTB14_033281 [Gonioctena quinquepunctata]
MHEQKEENYYFLTIDKDRMIDAGPKGNVARFMNHCCQPNCETQKWTVNGDTRVGLFASQDIPAETELTFNYNLECIGEEKKICRCGAPNCSGFIGVKAKQETEVRKPKKTYKKKEPEKPLALPPCFICRRKGNVGACNNKICNKAYHLKCLKMTEWPEGNKFVCPWHNCKICSKRTIRCCVKCINSFCPSHSEGSIRYDNLLGFVCTKHDPSNSQCEQALVRKKRNNIITEETAVTSTTSDDFDDDKPLLYRSSRRKKTKRNITARSDSEEFDLNSSFTSTPLKKPVVQNVSQDETVSSATTSDLEDTVISKRKRRRSRRNNQCRKRIRLSNVQNQSATANPNVNSKITRLEPAKQKETVVVPATPENIHFVLPEKYNNLLLHDSGSDDPKRILIFGHEQLSYLLLTHQNWLADGTFKVVPEIFFQLYTIHVQLDGIALGYCQIRLKKLIEDCYVC